MDPNRKRARRRGAVGFVDDGSSEEDSDTPVKRLNSNRSDAVATEGHETPIRSHETAQSIRPTSVKEDILRKQVSILSTH